jgi:glycosyltransferase involved in cell wall biosynthesis
MRWICCQLGAREHYAVPRALARQGALESLVTDIWVRPGNPVGQLRPSLRSRYHSDLASAEVYSRNADSIMFELCATAAGLQGWKRIIARNRWFQRKAVARLSRLNRTTMPITVMAYSYAARDILRWARSRDFRTVLGQIDPGPPEDRLVARLYEQNPVYGGSWQRPPAEYWASWHEECALADRIVVNSKWSLRALISEGIPEAKIKIVPLAYEASGATVPKEYPSAFSLLRPLRILFLGQVNLRKGVGPVLEAIRLLRGDPVEFTFVGPTQIPIPQDLRDDPHVHWIGAIPNERATEFYRDADLFLFPTFSDGFGLTQLEAQAWRLPVVATQFCGDVVEHGKNGWLLPEVTPLAIAAAIRAIYADPARLQKVSDCSLLTERFGLAQIGQEWLQAVE